MINDQQWYLFGYDMRLLGRHWLGAWRDLFFGLESPLRHHLGEVVFLENPDGAVQHFQSGEPLPGHVAPTAPCHAICLPDELVLCRHITLPRAVEADLDSALAIEVSASSPFAADDTAWGWRLAGRGENTLEIDLAIAARSSVMGFLGREHEVREATSREVWARVQSGMAVLGGFGEGHREAHYRRRLRRVGLMAGGILVAIFLFAGVYAFGRQLELTRVEALAAETGARAAGATELRETIADANRMLLAAKELAALHPSPHRELARLTRLLGDDSWVAHLSAQGDLLRIRGRAGDAAGVMQALSAEPAYAEVTAPQAISRVGNTGDEQFYLDIRLAGEAGP